MKKISMLVLLLTLLMVAPLVSYADRHEGTEGRHRPMKGNMMSMESMSSEEKFSHKAEFILMHQKDLALTDEQLKAIKGFKMETKKMELRQNADIEIFELDINAKLSDMPIDVEAVNTLIDQKYELKKAKAKSFVSAYVKLKGTLSEDQIKKLKDLSLGMKSMEHHEGMKSKMHHKDK